jgi:hypothetical protein
MKPGPTFPVMLSNASGPNKKCGITVVWDKREKLHNRTGHINLGAFGHFIRFKASELGLGASTDRRDVTYYPIC